MSLLKVEFVARLRDLVERAREWRTSYVSADERRELEALEAVADAAEVTLTTIIDDLTASRIWRHNQQTAEARRPEIVRPGGLSGRWAQRRKRPTIAAACCVHCQRGHGFLYQRDTPFGRVTLHQRCEATWTARQRQRRHRHLTKGVFSMSAHVSRIAVLLVALGGVAPAAHAQDATIPTIQPGRTYVLAFDHEGEPDVKFRLWVNGQRVKDFGPGEITKGPAIAGTAKVQHQFQFTAPTAPGQYVIGVSAFAPDLSGKEFDSAPAALGVKNDRTAAPNAPTNLIIKIQVNVEIKQGGGS